LIWLSGADQVNLIMWSQYDRMKHRSKISALYSSIGPAIGTLIVGYILQSSSSSTTNMEDYALIYKICVALFSLSFVVSWGWTSDD
jgi:chromate transport protein ChrA